MEFLLKVWGIFELVTEYIQNNPLLLQDIWFSHFFLFDKLKILIKESNEVEPENTLILELLFYLEQS